MEYKGYILSSPEAALLYDILQELKEVSTKLDGLKQKEVVKPTVVKAKPEIIKTKPEIKVAEIKPTLIKEVKKKTSKKRKSTAKKKPKPKTKLLKGVE